MDTSKDRETASKYGRVKKDVSGINEKVEALDRKVVIMDDGYSPLPGRVGHVEDNLYSNSGKIDHLEQSNRVHSAKLEFMQKQIKHMKLKNEILDEQLTARGHDRSREDPRDNYYSDYSRPEPERQPEPEAEPWREEKRERRMPEHARTPSREVREDDRNGRDREKYLAENERHKNNPEALESSRREKEHGNKWNLDEMRQKSQREHYGYHDMTTINRKMWEEKPEHKHDPWFDHSKLTDPGGFGFIRFHDDGYEKVNNALKGLHSILRNCGGYVLGIARKEMVHVYDCPPSSEWIRVRDQDNADYMKVANSIVAIWFRDCFAGEQFFQSAKNNRFRDTAFPTPHGHDSFYVPIKCPLPPQQYHTFLIIELLRGRQYRPEDLAQFEADLRQDMQEMVPNCHPIVVNSLDGRDYYRPGPFINPYSQMYGSGFMHPEDAQYYLKAGRLLELKAKYNLHGDMSVFTFTTSN